MAYERKRQYKEVSSGLQSELTETTNKLVELQRISNETSQQMSRAINVLQDERAALASRVEDRENDISKLKEEFNELRSQLDRSEEEKKRKSKEIEHLQQQLESKESSIKDAELQNSQLIQEQAIAKERALNQEKTIAELTSSIELVKSKFASYSSDKESLIHSLQQNLTEVEARHVAAKANLESSKAALDESKRELERMKSIESQLDALASKSESSFADVRASLSNLESTSSRTESLVKTTNDLQAGASAKEHVFDKMIEGNDMLQASVMGLSRQSSEIHQSFSAVQRDVSAANESLVKLERLSDRIKGSLSDVQIGLSAASTNDVIIARLEDRSVHIEEMLLNIQQELGRTSINDNTNAFDDQMNQVQFGLSTLQESFNDMQKHSQVLGQIQDSLSQIQGLGYQKSDPATAEALNRLDDRTNEISDTLKSIQAALPVNNPSTPEISQIVKSNLDQQNNASALAANDLVASCVPRLYPLCHHQNTGELSKEAAMLSKI
jgi:chromosome segregation ATPase